MIEVKNVDELDDETRNRLQTALTEAAHQAMARVLTSACMDVQKVIPNSKPMTAALVTIAGNICPSCQKPHITVTVVANKQMTQPDIEAATHRMAAALLHPDDEKTH